MQSYFYTPLPPPPRMRRSPPFTRILSLAPGTGHDAFRGFLEIFNAGAAPPYETLSYTWGSGEPQTLLLLDRGVLPIKPNLAQALYHLRWPTLWRRLWIDAICINQADVVERSRQVRYMRLIYQNATRTVVWLGPKTTGVDGAFQLARSLAFIRAALIENAKATSEVDEAPDPSSEVREMITTAKNTAPAQAMEHLQDLLRREYFYRVWCVQEITSSASSIAKCEELEIDFLDLIACTAFAGRPQNIFRDTVASWDTIYEVKKGIGQEDADRSLESLGLLEHLLLRTRSFRATDPRDMLFAVIDLSGERRLSSDYTEKLELADGGNFVTRRALSSVLNFFEDQELDIKAAPALEPNYQKDVISVYRDATRHMTRIWLGILSHVQHTTDPASGSFPSWVPRYDQPLQAWVLGINIGFRAGFRSDPELSVFDPKMIREYKAPRYTDHSLIINGYPYDSVEKVATPFERTLLGIPASSGGQLIATLKSAWVELTDRPFLAPADSQNEPEEPPELSFCLALCLYTMGFLMSSRERIDLELIPEAVLPRHDRPLEEQKRQARCDAANFLLRVAETCASWPTRFDSLAPEAARGDGDSLLRGVATCSVGRRAFITRNGRFGLGPSVMQKDDEIVVLFGSQTPSVVRRHSDSYLFIGECYVLDDKLMHGQLTDEVKEKRPGRPTRRTYALR